VATADAGRPGVFGYWGHAGGSVNVTVVREGRVVLRSRILASARGNSVSLPQSPTAKR
jgi:hypothetical protein